MLQVLERFLSAVRALVVRPVALSLPAWVTPNALSVSRLVLAGVVGVLLVNKQPASALVLYVLAAATDALDGELARARTKETVFGSRLDPAVDKLLQGVVFLAFFEAAPRLITLVLAGDVVLFLAASLLAVHPAMRNADVSASAFGKWKLLCQALASLVLFWNAMVASARFPSDVLELLLALAVAFAGFSILGYARRLFLLTRASA